MAAGPDRTIVKSIAMRTSCSTPFGITAVITSHLRSRPIQSTMCSTPFGITAVITSEPTHNERRTGVCSTPFGITAVITKSAEDSR